MKTNRFRWALAAACVTLALLLCTTCIRAGAHEYQWDDFDANCRFAAELFGFDENVSLPYLPTYVDPVTFRGCIAADGGIRENDYCAVYLGWNESDAEAYRNYLAFWGYQCMPQPCEIQGAQDWVLRSPTYNPQYRFPLDEIQL